MRWSPTTSPPRCAVCGVRVVVSDINEAARRFWFGLVADRPQLADPVSFSCHVSHLIRGLFDLWKLFGGGMGSTCLFGWFL